MVLSCTVSEIIIIIITTTIFIVLSSWQSHCESSLGSRDEYVWMRYGDLLAKIAYFSYPSLIRRPRSVCSLRNFTLKLTMRKLDPMIVAWAILTQCQRVTDRQTDGRIYYSYSTALCIASYADALQLTVMGRELYTVFHKKHPLRFFVVSQPNVAQW